LKRELHDGIINHNTQNVKKILDYASKNKIILELNEKDIDGWYPLLEVTYYNNTEIVKLLIEYANKNKIILELMKKIIKDGIHFLKPLIIIILRRLNY